MWSPAWAGRAAVARQVAARRAAAAQRVAVAQRAAEAQPAAAGPAAESRSRAPVAAAVVVHLAPVTCFQAESEPVGRAAARRSAPRRLGERGMTIVAQR